MAYTIIKSDGTVLTTIADGTINTTSTTLGLPGRNYAGYGQTLDTNLVWMAENFADSTPPPNPMRGQLWYNTNANTLYVCPADGSANANAWLALTSTASGGTTTFGAVTVTGNLQANNITALNAFVGDTITVRLATVTDTATVANASITSGNIGTLTTSQITAGSTVASGNLTGVWTFSGSGNAAIINSGNIYISNAGNTFGIKTDKYMYANGDPISFAGTYTNANVSDYLTGGNAVSQFTGNIAPTKVTTTAIAGGGTISGIWTLAANARMQATYADLAERFEADSIYDPGTVVELGGDKEITSVKMDLSEDVFGGISDTAAYLMNSGAGSDKTHPPVAVSGRVQVKVEGKVRKGQRLVSAGNGKARAAAQGEATAFNTIGRSLVDKTDSGTGTVEAIVIIR